MVPAMQFLKIFYLLISSLIFSNAMLLAEDLSVAKAWAVAAAQNPARQQAVATVGQAHDRRIAALTLSYPS